MDGQRDHWERVAENPDMYGTEPSEPPRLPSTRLNERPYTMYLSLALVKVETRSRFSLLVTGLQWPSPRAKPARTPFLIEQVNDDHTPVEITSRPR